MHKIPPTLCLILGCLFGANLMAEPFSAEQLVRLDRVGGPSLSPDGKRVVHTIRKTDMDANKGRYDLYLTRVADGRLRRLTSHQANDTSAAWSGDGRFVYFLSSRSDSSQVWRIAVDGGEAEQVTDLPLDVGSFRLSPVGDALVVSLEVYLDCDDLDCSRDRDQAIVDDPTTGVAYAHIFVRHWDHWFSEKRSQLFALALDASGRVTGQPIHLSHGIDADVPSRVWGGNEEYAISPDGKTLFFAARIRDAVEARSTNFDLYAVAMDGKGQARNLTKANPAWDTQPVVSPDGKTLAYLAMSRPGFEADRFQIMLRDLNSGKTRKIATDWDRSPASIAFSADGKWLYMNAQDLGNKTLWRVRLGGGKPERLVDKGTVSSFDVGPRGLVYAMDSLTSPSELYAIDSDAGDSRQLTRVSATQLTDVAMGEYQQFSFTGAGGETVYGYVVKPAGFKKGQRYPLAFLIHGGPQGSFSNHFHYRWNPQTYAGQGFAAVFIDFHGSTGYGQAFTDSISGDWGGKPLEDLKLGLAAALEKYDFIDGQRVCALGASYGGFMINWIAGNWPDRFDCLINHDGVFDQRMMYYATEELWFPEWENGGPQYTNPAGYEKYNPVNHVANWHTPMLVIHGQHDYRIPVSQGLGAFTALQRRGIESRFLYFPDENHWVLKPHNSVQWHHEVNAWLHHYLDD